MVFFNGVYNLKCHGGKIAVSTDRKDSMKNILILLLISGFSFYSAHACESVLEPGPYQAGHQTWMLEDSSRGVAPYNNSMGSDTRKLVTEIWYPSDDVSGTISGKNAPLTASPGPFPLIVYSHGILSERMETVYIGTLPCRSRGCVHVVYRTRNQPV